MSAFLLSGCSKATTTPSGHIDVPISHTPNDSATQEPKQPVVTNEPENHQHREYYDNAINEKQFELAHDYLLAAMRLEPDSEWVFKSAIEFVYTTQGHDSDEENELLGVDVLNRIESLIPWQPVERIRGAREKFNQLISEIESKSTLLATSSEPENEDETASLLHKYEEWCKTAERLVRETRGVNDTTANDQITSLGVEVSNHRREGGDLYSRLSANPDVIEVNEYKNKIEKQLENLYLAGEWLYNIWAYHTIKDCQKHFDAKNKTDRRAKNRLLEYMCGIEEQRLHPWFLEQYNELWKTLFNYLKSPEDKVEVTRARLLHLRPEPTQPSPEANQPTSEADQPPPEPTQPSPETNQPTSEADQPPPEPTQPSPEANQPTSEADQPPPEPTQPSPEPNQPSSEPTQ